MQKSGTHRRWWLRGVAVIVVLCMTATACGGGGSSAERSGSSTGGSSSDATGSLTVPDTRQALLDAGVTILADNGTVAAEPTPPVSAMVVQESWLPLLTTDAASRAGFIGADMDALGGGAPTGIPPSAVLAAYVRGVDTDGAALSKRLLEGQDLLHPDRVVFPALVLTLFAADASRAIGADALAASGSSAGTLPTNLQLIGSTPCTDVTRSIFGTINKIFDAIQIPPINLPKTGVAFIDGLLQGFVDMVVGGVNIVINAARELVLGVAHYAIDKILAVIGEVAAVAAMLANFTVAIGHWSLDTTAEDANTRKGVDNEQIDVRVSVTATASTQSITGDDWPGWFRDCASAANVSLPSFRPVGAKVTWTIDQSPGDLVQESASVTKKDTELQDVDRKAIGRIGLVTGTETQEQSKKGAEQHGAVKVTAQVRRKQIEELRETLRSIAETAANDALGLIPPFIRKYLVDIVGSAVNAATEGLAGLLDTSVVQVIDVKYHGDPDDKQSPTATTPTTRTGDPCSLISDEEAAVIIGAGVTRNEPSSDGQISSCIKGTARTQDVRDGAFINYSIYSLTLDAFLVATEAGAPDKATLTDVGGVGDRALLVEGGVALVVGDGDKTLTVQIYKFGNLGTYDELAGLARTLLERT